MRRVVGDMNTASARAAGSSYRQMHRGGIYEGGLGQTWLGDTHATLVRKFALPDLKGHVTLVSGTEVRVGLFPLPLASQCLAQCLTRSRHSINIAQCVFQTMLAEEPHPGRPCLCQWLTE